MNESVPDDERIEAISTLHERVDPAATPHQRFIERLTATIGRPSFLYAILAFVAAWVVVNLIFIGFHLPADEPPFSLLQGIVSASALLISTTVLITQNRQLKLAEKRARLDLEINLLAERKIAKMIALLEELRRDLPNVRNRDDPEAKAMQARVDPHAVADAIDARLEAEVSAGDEGETPKASESKS